MTERDIARADDGGNDDPSRRAGEELRNLGYIVISPEGPTDGGDFGPHTPGTTTAGFREALEYAKEVNRNVFVVGGTRSGPGPDSEPVVYEFQETLEVPWFQDFDLRGSSSYIIKYVGDGDAVVLDSSMNCQYNFGVVWSDGDGAALRVKPRTCGPDRMTTFIASAVNWVALVNHGVVNESATGSGLVLDASAATIVQSTFSGEETNTQDVGVYLTDVGGDGYVIGNNRIDVRFSNQGTARGACKNLQVGDPGSTKVRRNCIDMSLHAPLGGYFDDDAEEFVIPDDYTAPARAIGAEIHGQNNLFFLSYSGAEAAGGPEISPKALPSGGNRRPGTDVIFGETARENVVYALNLPHGMTTFAEMPTNRIITADPNGVRVETPPLPPSGEAVANENPVPVSITILDSGDADDWTVRDVDGATMTGTGLLSGQLIQLNPGDSVAVTYRDPPSWRWRGIG